jgi:hypothetical protein
MSNPLTALHTAVIAALEAHPALNAAGVLVYDGVPERQAFPYIAVSDGLVTNWSTKTELGRDVRLALTLWDDGEAADRTHALMGAMTEAMAALPAMIPGWQIVTCSFIRSLIARDADGPWAGLVEHRVRLLAD